MATTDSSIFTVPYTEGTDNLVTQCNLLLNQVVNTLLTDNTHIRVINTYTYGSPEFEGYPIWNTPTDAGNVYNSRYLRPTFLSDIIVLGSDEDNYCVCAFMFRDPDKSTNVIFRLSLACSNKLDTVMTDYYTSKSITTKLWSPASYFVRLRTANDDYGVYIKIPLINNAITLYMLSYKGTYSKGYHFYSSNHDTILYGYSMTFTSDDLIVLSNDSNRSSAYTGYVAYYPLVVNLNEKVCTDPERIVPTSYTNGTIEDGCLKSLDEWGMTLDNAQASYSGAMVYPAHCLLTDASLSSGSNASASIPSTPNVSSTYKDYAKRIPFMSTYQLPKIKPGELFIRTQYIPNSSIKTDNIILLYTPLTTTRANSLFEVNGHTYLSRYSNQVTIGVRVD